MITLRKFNQNNLTLFRNKIYIVPPKFNCFSYFLVIGVV